jgi:hypothetical protein
VKFITNGEENGEEWKERKEMHFIVLPNPRHAAVSSQHEQ